MGKQSSLFSATSLLMALAWTGAQAEPPQRPFFEITVSSGFYTTAREVISVRSVVDEGGRSIQVAERQKTIRQGSSGSVKSSVHQWIDGRKCPALEVGLKEIAQLPNPSPKSANPPFHGAEVAVVGETSTRKIALKDYEGPVTAWWRKLDGQLGACWGDGPIVVAGETIAPTLMAESPKRAPDQPATR